MPVNGERGISDRRDSIADDWKERQYYEKAEGATQAFWAKSKPFRPLFNRLDRTAILELACGHGRHVPNYIDDAGEVILVDVNRENIDFCKERFSGRSIRYIVNSGDDLPGVSNNSLTAIFCYDAMVHFELFDVYSYLVESHRTLVPGGMALFHHSNFTGSPENEYKNNPHWRNFMSAQIFRYLASRAGLAVVHQEVIDWGAGKRYFQHDCISLVRKS